MLFCHGDFAGASPERKLFLFRELVASRSNVGMDDDEECEMLYLDDRQGNIDVFWAALATLVLAMMGGGYEYGDRFIGFLLQNFGDEDGESKAELRYFRGAYCSLRCVA